MNVTVLPNKNKIQFTCTCFNTPQHKTLKRFLINNKNKISQVYLWKYSKTALKATYIYFYFNIQPKIRCPNYQR